MGAVAAVMFFFGAIFAEKTVVRVLLGNGAAIQAAGAVLQYVVGRREVRDDAFRQPFR